MLKGGVLLVGGGFAAKFLNLLRTALLARLLSVEDYSVVATFALTAALLEMLAQLSLDRLVVQDRDGDDPKFIATIHTLQLIRGCCTGIVLFVLAGPYARLMGIEGLVWPYQVMAILPVCNALINLDIHRQQRHNKFIPYITWMFSLDLAGLVFVGALAFQLTDWSLGLGSILIGQIVATCVSHLMAKRPYRLGFDPIVAKRAFSFGWPLLINAALLFLIFNGDRIIVSNQLGLEVLAGFALASSLSHIPAAIINRGHQFACTPIMARHQDNPAAFDTALIMTMQTSMALALLMALGFSLLGPDVMPLIFGQNYTGLGTLIILLGIYQGVRQLAGGTAVVALAKAETKNPFRSALVRVLGLPVGLYAVMQGASVEVLVTIGAFFEGLAFCMSFYLLRRLLGGIPAQVYRDILISGAIIALLFLDVWMFPPSDQLFASFHWFQLVLIGATLTAIWCMGNMRIWVVSQLRRRSGNT